MFSPEFWMSAEMHEQRPDEDAWNHKHHVKGNNKEKEDDE